MRSGPFLTPKPKSCRTARHLRRSHVMARYRATPPNGCMSVVVKWRRRRRAARRLAVVRLSTNRRTLAASANAFDLSIDIRVLLIDDLLRRRYRCGTIDRTWLAVAERCRPGPGCSFV